MRENPRSGTSSCAWSRDVSRCESLSIAIPRAPFFIASRGSGMSPTQARRNGTDCGLRRRARQAIVAEVSEAARREACAHELDDGVANRSGDPAQDAVADDVVELFAVAGIGQRIADMEIDVLEPAASTSARPRSIASLERSKPTGLPFGDTAAKAMRLRPSPQPISSNGGGRGIGGPPAVKQRTGAQPVGREELDDEARIGNAVVDEASVGFRVVHRSTERG